MAELFVSYSRDDTGTVMPIVENLRKLGFDLWIDVEHLTPGTPAWSKAIDEALWRVDGVLAFLSPTAKESTWCTKETIRAQEFEKPIYPILLSGNSRTAIPFHLVGIQYADMRGRASRSENLERLIDTLTRELNHTPPDHQVEEDTYGRPVIQINVTGTVEGHINVIGGDYIEQVGGDYVAGDQNIGGDKVAGDKIEQVGAAPAPAPEPETTPSPEAVPALEEPLPAADTVELELDAPTQHPKVAARAQRTLKLTEPPAIIIASIIGGLFALSAVLLAFGVFSQNDTPDEPESEPVVAAAEQEPEATASPTMPTVEASATIEEAELTDAPTPTASPEPTPTPLPLGFAPVTRNNDWEPVIQEFNGVEMALVPVGCFMMGSEEGDDDEAPVHEVCFEEPFWIDVYEVTNEQYGSTSCEFRSSGPYQPRICINWTASAARCENRDARLPTEAEWEFAARGPDSLVYPWGNEFVADNVVYNFTSNSQTAPVGSKPDGISWVGAYDMSGNVWEWVADWYDSDYYSASPGTNPQGPDSSSEGRRVLRGGSGGNTTTHFLRAAFRSGSTPVGSSISIGFRCARSYQP